MGGIMIDGRTPLHVFRSGSVTGQIYRDEVLDPYVRLFRGAYGRDFLFMDDNARPHRANLVDEFLEKNLWDYLGRAIARRHPPPRDVNGLKTALLEEWSLIPQTVINNVISSLKTRCDMCVRDIEKLLIAGAVPLAVDLVNEDPELLPFHNLRFIAYDAGDAESALPLKKMTQMREEGVVGFIGLDGSCEHEALLAAAWDMTMVSYSPNLKIGSGISNQTWNWEIVGPDQDNGVKYLNYCIVIDRSLAVTKSVFQSIDCGTSSVTCCAVLLEPQLLDIMIVQFRNEKVSNHGSIPITIDCNVVAFIVFEEGFHHPIKRTQQFVEWAQNEIAVVPDFHKRILFSDEAHLWSNGYVKKQNCRIWSEANPQVYVETPLHPEKLTVWCALWAGGVLLQKG
ncbi:transposable element Tcb2 transposase [Trichonephila clavipes]|nr:transposable element Tcb2 transposase [Trichonephila clavipes]